MKLKFLFILSILVFALHSCSKDEPKVEANNPPVLEDTTLAISENAASGTVLITLATTDEDGDALGYDVEGDSGPFTMSNVGVLTLSGELDYDETNTYTFTVNVYDGKSSASATFTINVTKVEPENQAPIIEDQGSAASELSTSEKVLHDVEAEDPEGSSLVFEITANDNNLFVINELGEIRLAEGQNLDFESQESHQITVTVSDGIDTAEAVVTITVQDEIESLFEDPESFITTWQTISNQEVITIATVEGLEYDYTIDWGDGTIQDISSSESPSHEFQTAGNQIIAIKGTFPRLKMDESPSRTRLKSVVQWGTIIWSSFVYAFSNCSNLVSVPTTSPDLTNVTNLAFMFENATSFNSDLSSWNTQNIENMAVMFQNATSFNGAIGNWDVGSVKNMTRMFEGATSFNQSLGNWIITNIDYNMSEMLNNSGLSPENYNATLVGWATQNDVPSNIKLGADGLTYCGDAAIEARDFLVNEKSWTITGDQICI